MACDGPVHLRRATPADAAGIANVQVRSWRRAHDGLVPPEHLSHVRVQQRADSWRGELEVEAPGRGPWVALVDDRVVGYACAGISRDEDADLVTGEVYDVYVDPECWGRGIGRNLLAHAVRDLRSNGFATATFWVVAQNAIARTFAEHAGWNRDGASRFDDCAGIKVQEIRYSHALR